jgi:hypothetical protein
MPRNTVKMSLDIVSFMFYGESMDWTLFIERNRALLLPIVAGLFAKIGLTENGAVERLSRPLYRIVLARLRAAEAAVRRLIIVMARDIKVEPRPKRPRPSRPFIAGNGKSKAQGNGQSRPPSFQLCDPQKRSDAGRVRRRRRHKGPEPRIRVLDYDPRIPEFLRGSAPAPAPQQIEIVKDNTVSAKRLCRRLFALIGALTNMEREAKRYALWLARPVEERRPKRERALRFGWPPGWRVRPTHEVHEILKECHRLVRELPEPDTS